MHWDGYTVFSVISGIALLLMALAKGKASSRALMAAAGAVLIIYGIFVGMQTSGTFVFPVWIFVIPFVAAGKFVLDLAGRSQRRPQDSAPPHPTVPGQATGTLPPPPGQATSGAHQAPADGARPFASPGPQDSERL